MANELDFWRPNGLMLSPFREFRRFQRAMNRLFEDFPESQDTLGDMASMRGMLAPSYDVEETDSHSLYMVDLPGVKKEDINIQIINNNLVISGERKEEKETKGKSTKMFEARYGQFQRSFPLQGKVDMNKIEANFDNGVLRIAVPKSEETKAYQVKISEGKSGVFSKLLGKRGEDNTLQSTATRQ